MFHTATPTPKTPIFEGVNQKSVGVGVAMSVHQPCRKVRYFFKS